MRLLHRRVSSAVRLLLLLLALWPHDSQISVYGAPLQPHTDSEVEAAPSPMPPLADDPSPASTGALGRVRRIMGEHPVATALVSGATGALLTLGVPRVLRRVTLAQNREAMAILNRLVAESHRDNRGDGRFIRCFERDIFSKLVRYEAVKGKPWGLVTLRAEDVNEQVEKCAREAGVPLPAGDAWRFRRGSMVTVRGTPGPPASSMSAISLAAPPTFGPTHSSARDPRFDTQPQFAAQDGDSGHAKALRSHYDELRAAFGRGGVKLLLDAGWPARSEADVTTGGAGSALPGALRLFRGGAGAGMPGVRRY